jgi:hypothetical protein
MAVEWGAATVVKPAIHEDVQVLSPQPGRRNSVAFHLNGVTTALGTEDDALKATTCIGFTVPMSLPDGLPRDYNGVGLNTMFIGYNHLLRGTLSKPQDTRVVIIADAAGTMKVFEFPFGVGIGDTAGTQISPDFVLTFFSIMKVLAEGVPQKYSALAPYAVSLVVSVERCNQQAEVYVALDTMDVEATYSAPDGPVPPAYGCGPGIRFTPFLGTCGMSS